MSVRSALSGIASSISEGDILVYSCSAQLISFEIDSIPKEIDGAEHEYINMSPSCTCRAGDATVGTRYAAPVTSNASLFKVVLQKNNLFFPIHKNQ